MSADEHPLAQTPTPPYYAVIFTSVRKAAGRADYDERAQRMVELARNQPGFLGVESVRDGDRGITVSYWASEEAIRNWKAHWEHRDAQRRGRMEWYEAYEVRVARVERAYGFGAEKGDVHPGGEG